VCGGTKAVLLSLSSRLTPPCHQSNGSKTGRVFADELANTARLLIDHPAGGRPWKVIGPAKDRGFWYLESAAPIGKVAGRMDYQRFRIYLHDTQFERTK